MQLFIFSQILNTNNVKLPHKSEVGSGALTTVFNIIFGVIGALALLMLVIAGFKYTISQGDPNKVGEIKNQILYALVGLIVSISAAAFVNFVLVRF